MNDTTDHKARLRTAVEIIWQECGETPPSGEDLDRAAINLANALSSGRRVPRVADKTFQPLYGPRRDLE